MRRPTHITGMILATLAALWCVPVSAASPDPDIPAARRHQLMSLLDQDCGSCHGLTRQGGLGPALTKQALAGKSPEMLREVILNGRPGTPMPPWNSFVNEQEADWLAQVLLEGKTDAH
jgi:cytochrome c55X